MSTGSVELIARINDCSHSSIASNRCCMLGVTQSARAPLALGGAGAVAEEALHLSFTILAHFHKRTCWCSSYMPKALALGYALGPFSFLPTAASLCPVILGPQSQLRDC